MYECPLVLSCVFLLLPNYMLPMINMWTNQRQGVAHRPCAMCKHTLLVQFTWFVDIPFALYVSFVVWGSMLWLRLFVHFIVSCDWPMSLHHHGDGLIVQEDLYKHVLCAFVVILVAPSLPMYVLLILRLNLCEGYSTRHSSRGSSRGGINEK
jgi:hypothetical protein